MRIVAEALAWWLVIFGLDLLFISTVDRNELLLACGAATVATAAGIIGRRATRRRYPFAIADLAPLARIPLAVVTETPHLVRLVLARPRPIGRWQEGDVPARAVAGDTREVAAAAFTVGQTATPGEFVADLSGDVAVVHALRRRGSA